MICICVVLYLQCVSNYFLGKINKDQIIDLAKRRPEMDLETIERWLMPVLA